MASGLPSISDDNFRQEVLESEVPVVVDFTAEWCGPCKAIAPAIEALARANQGRVKFVQIDVDANQQFAQQFRVMSMPTFILFRQGQVAGQVIGAHKDKVEGMVQQALS
jgi:thioredoxin 1